MAESERVAPQPPPRQKPQPQQPPQPPQQLHAHAHAPPAPHEGEAGRLLATVGERVEGAFRRDRSLLSLEEYLDLVLAEPRTHLRGAAQFLKDVFDYYGTDTLETPAGKLRRFRLFDLDLDGDGPVFGQEEAQNAIYRVLGGFVRLGRVNKLILLHGPNGSAKSSIVGAMARGMEAYSRTPEGALYRFNWVFPTDRTLKGAVGFGGGDGIGPRAASSSSAPRRAGGAAGGRAAAAAQQRESFAHIEEEAIEARLACELSDHPLLLMPKPERQKLLERLAGALGEFAPPLYLLEGELCPKCRQIYAALLTAYHGDYLEVLRHVQVERFYVDRRYQQSAVTIEPQLSVDAGGRQVTADRSATRLPAALQNLTLVEPVGPLVRANRGLLEYADLLKRPVEAFKYLLGFSETGQIPLEPSLLHLEQVLVASSNDKHLAAFKELPDFASFKGRIELVRVPYVRRVGVERAIYEQQITGATVGRHVAPHTAAVAATWAVLTRLKKPVAERYAGEMRGVVNDLSPMEKLALYDRGEVPDRLSSAHARELRKVIPDLWRESEDLPRYEGGSGASAREVKTALFHAAQDPEAKCLGPLQVIAQLDALCRDKSVYEYLHQEVVDGFSDHAEFVRTVERMYLDRVEEEVRESLGLISEAQYQELFERYVVAVSHWVKGEKQRNRITGEYEDPRTEQMQDVEAVVMGEDEDRREFRRAVISTIGAFRLDHPDAPVEYPRIFPELFRRLRDHYYEERKRTLRRYTDLILRYLAGDRAGMLPKECSQVQAALEAMERRFGYCSHCAQEALLVLVRRRYAEDKDEGCGGGGDDGGGARI